MLEAFLEGFLLGLGAALPLGPINILIMNNALKNYKAGVAIGFGAMSADVLYLSLILTGLVAIMSNTLVVQSVGTIGALLLFYFAYKLFKNRESVLQSSSDVMALKNIFQIYLQGFVLTLFNPYTVLFWISVAGYAASKNSAVHLTIAGMLFAITLWTTLMPYAVHRSKHRLSSRAGRFLSIVSSLILAGFALLLLMRLFFT